MKQPNPQGNVGPIKQLPQFEDEVLDVKKYLFLFLSNWYWFVLTIFLAFAGSWLYLRYTMKVWKVSTTLLIEEDKRNPSMGRDKIMEGFGLNPGLQNLENQLIILKSWSLMGKALSELPFGIEYYYMGEFNKHSLYKSSPVEVLTDSLNPMVSGVEFTVSFLGEARYRITASENDFFELDQEASWGDTVEAGASRFSLMKTAYWSLEAQNQELFFNCRSHDNLVRAYRSRLNVAPASSEATIVELSLESMYPKMDLDFLEKLTEVFLSNNLEKKNQEAVRTIDFIDAQLSNIADSLVLTENRLQEFRSRNRVMNISDQATRILEQAVKLEDDKARLIVEANYYKYLKEYLQKDGAGEQAIAPATLGISYPLLVSLVQQLAGLQTDFNSMGHSKKNPMRATLISQMRNTRAALLETLESIIRANEIVAEENANRLKVLNQQAVTLPVTERELLGIERQFKLNDALYTLLLEKQAEAMIQKASNSSDSEVVDSARVEAGAIKPNTKMIYMLGLIFGLGIPALILLIADYFDVKIRTEEDIRKLTALPLIGHIPHCKKPNQHIVLDDPSAVITEMFRSLRTHLQFFTKDTSSPVILVTSSVPGEGKTFTSVNLAAVYSLTGKRVMLLGADLRRPGIYQDSELDHQKGLSTWLIGKHSLEEITQESGFDHLHVILGGAIPPNPSELLNTDELGELIQALKANYDYIIVDSAPIGTVSDTYSLSKLADVTILITRSGYTHKKMLENTLLEVDSTGLNNTSVLLNDLEIKAGYGYGYGYRYYGK